MSAVNLATAALNAESDSEEENEEAHVARDEKEEENGANEDAEHESPYRMLFPGLHTSSASSFTERVRSFFGQESLARAKERGDANVQNIAQARLKMLEYQEKRARNEFQWYLAVVRGSQLAVALGMALRVIGLFVAFGASNDSAHVFYTGFVIQLVGTSVLMVGILVTTVCPVLEGEDGCVVPMSVDEAMGRNPRVWTSLCIASVAVSVVEAYSDYPSSYPYCSVLGAGPGLYGLFAQKAVYERYMPRPTTLTVLWLFLTLFGWGLTYLYQGFVIQRGAFPAFLGVSGVLRVVVAIVSFVVWLRFIRLSKTRSFKANKSRHPDSTLGMFVYSYVFLITSGVGNIILAVGCVTSGQNRLAIYNFVTGVVWSVPTLILLSKGRRETRLFVRRRFENAASRFDGAFIAQLLDAVPVSVGSVWHVLRAAPNESYTDDHQKYWERGVVTEVSSSGAITVSVEQESAQDEGRISFSHLPFNLSSPTSDHTVQIPACADKTSAELIDMAEEQLRCIEWKNIDLQLMTGSVLGSDAVDLSTLISKSRLVAKGEKIDFFMSHSWKDDSSVKFSALTAIAEKFKKANGRYPTFWLDKVCIDQTNITDGLKVLPIHVCSCEKMLVLCGETYAKRLWCIWELFTLFAFSNKNQAREKVDLVPLLSPSQDATAVLTGLENFALASAHCFDPNEEARLRNIIHARGERSFEHRVREFSGICVRDLQERRKATPSALFRVASIISFAPSATVGSKLTSRGKSTEVANEEIAMTTVSEV